MSMIATPCLRICTLDPASGLCRGCGRSVEEIAAWARYSDVERARIMALLPHRVASLGVAASSSDENV
jgi:predicted Fe-S protein YdhL (DUF1289 family)